MTLPGRLLIFSLFCLFLVSCREKGDVTQSPDAVVPDSLIPPERMTLILADVHIIEAAMLVERTEVSGPKVSPAYYYRGIFSKYHISAVRYEQNLAFYRKDPENYAKIYAKVIALIESRQKQMNGAK